MQIENTGIEQLGVKQFHAKIGVDNTASIQMFKKFGFEEASRSDYFGEVTMAVSDHEIVRFLKDHDVQYSTSDHCLV